MDTTIWSRSIAHEAIANRSCYQNPSELSRLLQLLAEKYQPQLVLEIGAGLGGSAWAWGQLPTVREVMTVTLPEKARHWHCCPMDARHWVYLGDSTSEDTAHAVTWHLGGRRPDFVWIDGDHSYRAASADWSLYGKLVAPDGLVGLHDILPNDRYLDFDVHRLWDEIQEQYPTSMVIGPDVDAQGTGLVMGRVL